MRALISFFIFSFSFTINLIAQFDDLLAQPNWSIVGTWQDQQVGKMVSNAGDINGDGYDDILITGNSENKFIGRVSLFYGSENGLSQLKNWKIDTDQTRREFGSSIASAGDVNGDGFDDIIIGDLDYNGYSRGKAFVFYGSQNGPKEIADWSTNISTSYAQLGYDVSTAGDVNGDGYDDIIIGAPGIGKVYLYYGSSEGLSVESNWTNENLNYLFFGGSLSSGDINNDGYSDVVIGAPNASNGEINEGVAFLFYGSANGLSQTPDWIFDGNQEEAYLGRDISAFGDINGDGYDDIIISAPKFNNKNGAVFGFFGGPVGPHDTADWILYDYLPYPWYFGNIISIVQDMNQDGFDEILIGSGRNQVSVYYGNTNGIAEIPNWFNWSTSEYSDPSFSSAGDVNGDGFGDILMGDLFFDNNNIPNTGRALLYTGPLKSMSQQNIIPIARYNLDQDGYTGLRVGATMCGIMGLGTAALMNIFNEELTVFLIQEGVTLGSEILFSSLLKEDNQPKNIVIGFSYNGNDSKSITNDDIVFLYEYENEELDLGYPYQITYEKGNTQAESDLIPPKVGKIIIANKGEINYSYRTIQDVCLEIPPTKWFAKPISFNTMGVVSGYERIENKLYMILSEYNVSGAWGLFDEPHLFFVPVDVSYLSAFPAIGSVVKVSGITEKLKYDIRQRYNIFRKSRKVKWALKLESNGLEILNGKFVNNVETGSNIMYLYGSKDGRLIGIKWPENLNALPDFDVNKENLSITNSDNFILGSSETVSVIVKNKGNAPGKCNVKFYYSEIDSEHLIDVANTNDIQPGESEIVSVNWDTNNLEYNNYKPLYIFAVVGTASPPEGNYSNNQAYIEIFNANDKSLVSTTAYCPVSLEVSAANGQTINPSINNIPNAEYMIDDFNDDNYSDHRVYVPNDNQIEYSIKVIPNDDALPNENFTLTIQEGNNVNVLAEDVKIEDAPNEPYTYITTDVEKANIIPTDYSLYQNYPNPFNPSTVIKFSIPELSNVKITIYNSIGEMVKSFVNEKVVAGFHNFEWTTSELTSGIYFIKLIAESNVSDKHYSCTKKAILLK